MYPQLEHVKAEHPQTIRDLATQFVDYIDFLPMSDQERQDTADKVQVVLLQMECELYKVQLDERTTDNGVN